MNITDLSVQIINNYNEALKSIKSLETFINNSKELAFISASYGVDAKMEEFKAYLREEHRIKYNCDWAFTHKYDKTYILCHEVYVSTIKEIAAKFEIEITGFLTYI